MGACTCMPMRAVRTAARPRCIRPTPPPTPTTPHSPSLAPPPPTPSPQCMYTFFGQFLVYCTPNPLVAQLLSAFFNQLWTIFNGACVRCVWCVVCVGGGVGEQ